MNMFRELFITTLLLVSLGMPFTVSADVVVDAVIAAKSHPHDVAAIAAAAARKDPGAAASIAAALSREAPGSAASIAKASTGISLGA